MPYSCFSPSSMDDKSDKKKPGCGLFDTVFRRRNLWPRRTSSAGSFSMSNANHVTSTLASKSRKDGFLDDRKTRDRIVARPGRDHARTAAYQHQLQAGQKVHATGTPKGQQGRRRVPTPAGIGISGELEGMITDYQKSNQAKSLVRASSSNVMLHGHLGNLRQLGKNVDNSKHSTRALESNKVVRNGEVSGQAAVSLCRALSIRMDPEKLKILGNEDYKNGKFGEAVVLYDAAISIDPNKALFALGKLLEAAFECGEAIRIDTSYQRAHNRLATICTRLGEAEKALHHFKQSGPEADPDAINSAKRIQGHLVECTEAKRRHDWNKLVLESSFAIEVGADSAPLILGLKAEALLKLNKVEEAIRTMENSPNFDIDNCTRFFGPIGSSKHLVYRAQVDLAAGRFDAAMEEAQRAVKLDPNSKEARMVSKKTKAVATARANGNDLYKARRYSEASIAYGEGLDHDPHNAVLLGNRGACRSKLGQYEKALEDCNASLQIRSSYSRARLRRADCYMKMGNWEACLQDCELLIKENPDNEEIRKIRDEAKAHLQKHGKSTSTVIVVSSKECFRDYVTSSGTSVVLFCNKEGNGINMQVMEQLSCRYPSVNFLKVEAEDQQQLTRSEGINSYPCFVIYAKGSKEEEVFSDKYQVLERLIQKHITS